jgi:hypothetical protein
LAVRLFRHQVEKSPAFLAALERRSALALAIKLDPLAARRIDALVDLGAAMSDPFAGRVLKTLLASWTGAGELEIDLGCPLLSRGCSTTRDAWLSAWLGVSDGERTGERLTELATARAREGPATLGLPFFAGDELTFGVQPRRLDLTSHASRPPAARAALPQGLDGQAALHLGIDVGRLVQGWLERPLAGHVPAPPWRDRRVTMSPRYKKELARLTQVDEQIRQRIRLLLAPARHAEELALGYATLSVGRTADGVGLELRCEAPPSGTLGMAVGKLVARADRDDSILFEDKELSQLREERATIVDALDAIHLEERGAGNQPARPAPK